MKKVFDFLRSMRFGILLLILIAVCSVVGSVIPQGKEIAWYAQTYQGVHGVILLLKLHNIFQSWYFILLMVLLCLNLLLCSILRIRTVVKEGEGAAERLARVPDRVKLTEEGLRKLDEHLRAMHCAVLPVGEARVYRKNAVGRYGTFLLHLAILLTVIFGGAALYAPTVVDQTCLPGESIFRPDGTEIRVEDFRIEDETGRLDFTSRIQVTLPDGKKSEPTDIKVNHPFSFGSYKIYQQTYGTAGSVTVTNSENGGSDDFTLTDTVFLSLDGANGLLYQAVYPGYLLDPSGNMTLITATSGRYDNPVYQVILVTNEGNSPMLAFPGDELEAEGLRFRFNEPVEYPGLRIKYTPGAVNVLLVASFLLMIAGIYITFFLQPVLVKADGEGYVVGGPKPEGMRIELEELLQDYQEERCQ